MISFEFSDIATFKMIFPEDLIHKLNLIAGEKSVDQVVVYEFKVTEPVRFKLQIVLCITVKVKLTHIKLQFCGEAAVRQRIHLKRSGHNE